MGFNVAGAKECTASFYKCPALAKAGKCPGLAGKVNSITAVEP